jgi:hypothetical protein
MSAKLRMKVHRGRPLINRAGRRTSQDESARMWVGAAERGKDIPKPSQARGKVATQFDLGWGRTSIGEQEKFCSGVDEIWL